MNKIERVGMKLPHVGAFIREEILEELGLSISRAAEILEVRRASVSDLVNEKAGLSPEMALRIEKAFGVKMDLLLKIQAAYDAASMRLRSDDIGVVRFVPEKPPQS